MDRHDEKVNGHGRTVNYDPRVCGVRQDNDYPGASVGSTACRDRSLVT
jgi:hypothetical protein